MKPLCIVLYAGLHGWEEGFIAEGYRCIGFDIVDMCKRFGYRRPPNVRLVLRDVLTLHGSEFRDAQIIVASPPCQEYSYRAMPWSRAKALPPPDNSLFDACFRIQREASESAGRYIPLIVENVRGAQKWVGRAKWHFGSYYLWGDLPALMPIAFSRKTSVGFWDRTRKNYQKDHSWKTDGGLLNIRDGHSHTRHLTNPVEHLRVEEGGLKQPMGAKSAWFDGGAASFANKSNQRRAASALIAKIPFPLAQHIARTFKPQAVEVA